jgi:hypothetical protein
MTKGIPAGDREMKNEDNLPAESSYSRSYAREFL